MAGKISQGVRNIEREVYSPIKDFLLSLETASEEMDDIDFLSYIEATVERGEAIKLYDQIDHNKLEDKLADAQAEGAISGVSFALTESERLLDA